MAGSYMIRSDMEGVTGVVRYEQVVPGQARYEYGVRMLMGDLLALVRGLNDGGAERIVIYDEHYDGMNIDAGQLPTNTSVICGKPPYREDWAGGLDATFDGMIMLGFHAMDGTEGGLLAHTYEPDIAAIRINGLPVGEIGVETAIAGDCGVPLVMITGDSAGVAEAEALVPGVAGIVVKEGQSADGAICYSPSLTAERIYRRAKELAATQRPQTKAWRPEGEVELTVELKPGPYRDTFRRLFGKRMAGDSAVAVTAPSVTAAWAAYWAMKLACQQEGRKG